MICKPCEEKSEVCFKQLLSELNANVLQQEKLLLYLCTGVCMCEYKEIASYILWILQATLLFGQTAEYMYKCKLPFHLCAF